MISLSFNTKTIVIILVAIGIIFIVWNSKSSDEDNTINNEENKEISSHENNSIENNSMENNLVQDSFWTNIINLPEDNKNLYQFQLPNNFEVNPKYLMFHPNFLLSANKLVQIVSEYKQEAVAMLYLWIALNKGLLDNEQNFAQLFETSIRRSINYPSVEHKFKIDINNLLTAELEENSPENLEYTEDLASLENNQDSEKIEVPQEINFQSVNSFDNNLASI